MAEVGFGCSKVVVSHGISAAAALPARFLFYTPGMTDFEDRVRRIAREAMQELGRDAGEIEDIVEPPGADYCVITFRNPEHKPIEIPKPLGAGESQEQDEVRRALQYRFPT
jgi:hypothetical protein